MPIENTFGVPFSQAGSLKGQQLLKPPLVCDRRPQQPKLLLRISSRTASLYLGARFYGSALPCGALACSSGLLGRKMVGY